MFLLIPRRSIHPVQEKKEASEWDDGAKTKKSKDLEKEAKKAADAAKKAEVARLLVRLQPNNILRSPELRSYM